MSVRAGSANHIQREGYQILSSFKKREWPKKRNKTGC